MKCQRCQSETPQGMNFCGICGAPLAVPCPRCGYNNPGGFKFCGQCGVPLRSETSSFYAARSPLDYTPRFLVERVLKTRGAMVGERKLVSVLFADVADFTAISEQVDPEAVHEIMDGCFEILGREIHRAGGTINQYTGDGVMALFGAPIAYDDHIQAACHAGLEIQRRIGEYEQQVQERHHVPFKMRIGIHTGPVVVGAIGDNLRLDYTAQGDTTNLAARLQNLAKPGSILVSEKVCLAAGDRFLFEDAGLFDIKGKKRPVRLFVLVGKLAADAPDADRESGPWPFVGRKRELALLERAYDDALTDGPKLAAITGSAGMGKTRLLHRFVETLRGKPPLFLEARCRPFGQTAALFPLVRMLRSRFGLSEEAPLKQLKARINDKIKDMGLRSALDQVVGLLEETEKRESDSPIAVEAKKRLLFRASRDLLIALAKGRPLILAVDNMQWVDAATKEFLSFLVQSAARAPILVVCLGRSDPEGWTPTLPDHLIRIKALSQKEASHLFSRVLGTKRLEPRTRRALLANAGGAPLFLVEVAENLKRQDMLACGSGLCRLKLPVSDLTVPESLQGVLASRLDALPEVDKEVAQRAAVIGREFSVDILSALTDNKEDLLEALEVLEREGIIERLDSRGADRYQFRQQMMQETAYQSLLTSEQIRLHRDVARAMETLYRDNLSPHFAALAYHFYKAEDWPKAFGYSLEAGNQARRSYACQEALNCFDRAIEILSKAELVDNQEISLQLFKWKGAMHYCLGQMEAGHKAFETMYAEAQRLGDREAEAEALFRIGWISFYMHEPGHAIESLGKAIVLSEKEGLGDILLKSLSSLGFVYSVLGRLKEARPQYIRALDLSSDLKDPESRAWVIASLLNWYNWTGEFEEALNLCKELSDLNQRLRSPYFNLFLRFHRGLVYGALGKTKEARKDLETGLSQLEVGDNPFWRPRLLNTLGWVLAEEGRIEEALRRNTEALRWAKEGGDLETLHNTEINLGENRLQMDQVAEARNILEEVWKEVKRPGVFYARWRYKTRLLIALGEVYGRLGDRPKGLRYINRALRLAEESHARKHRVRALFVKASLERESRPGEARRHLEKALALSKGMGTTILTARIEQALKTIGDGSDANTRNQVPI